MMSRNYLLLLVLILAAFLFIFTGCGDPVEPHEHMGPDEEEEMDENSEDDGYGMLTDYTANVVLF